MTHNNHSPGPRAAACALAALLWSAAMISPAGAQPTARQALYNAQVSGKHGATTGCGLSFIAGWKDAQGRSFAAAGVVEVASAGGKLGSTLKVRANMDNDRRTLSFAWMGVDGAGDTKGFSPPSPDQRGPFFSYEGKPDPGGPERLRKAARHGFDLDLKIIGLGDDARVRLPAAPAKVAGQVAKCTKALSASD